jgi:hypothetical protein
VVRLGVNVLRTGMINTWPGKITFGSLMLFTARMAAPLVPYRRG